MLVSPNIGKCLRAGRHLLLFFFWRDIANQGFSVKVRKYIIKVLRCKNANISVNEQPEWFHWAWSFYRNRKRFGDLDQWPWHVEKTSKKRDVIVYNNKNLHITELEDTRQVFILFYLLVIKYNDPTIKIWPGRVRGNRQSFFFGLNI